MSKIIKILVTLLNFFLFLFVAFISMGYNGRECVLRALCESAQFLYKEGTNMVEELVRIIF